jgi:hypothetical protein
MNDLNIITKDEFSIRLDNALSNLNKKDKFYNKHKEFIKRLQETREYIYIANDYYSCWTDHLVAVQAQAPVNDWSRYLIIIPAFVLAGILSIKTDEDEWALLDIIKDNSCFCLDKNVMGFKKINEIVTLTHFPVSSQQEVSFIKQFFSEMQQEGFVVEYRDRGRNWEAYQGCGKNDIHKKIYVEVEEGAIKDVHLLIDYDNSWASGEYDSSSGCTLGKYRYNVDISKEILGLEKKPRLYAERGWGDGMNSSYKSHVERKEGAPGLDVYDFVMNLLRLEEVGKEKLSQIKFDIKTMFFDEEFGLGNGYWNKKIDQVYNSWLNS